MKKTEIQENDIVIYKTCNEIDPISSKSYGKHEELLLVETITKNKIKLTKENGTYTWWNKDIINLFIKTGKMEIKKERKR